MDKPATTPTPSENNTQPPVPTNSTSQGRVTSPTLPPPPTTTTTTTPPNERPRNPGIGNVPPNTSNNRVPGTPNLPPATSGIDGELPADLAEFVYYFNESAKDNDPAASLGFYDDRVISYFGRKNQTPSDILEDRANYIRKYPTRKYDINGQPKLLSAQNGVYEVKTRVKYSVSNSSRPITGTVDDYLVIRKTDKGYRIAGIDETKAGAPKPQSLAQAAKICREENARYAVGLPGNDPAAVDRPALPGNIENRIGRMMTDFTACGQINDPVACVEFMHPQMNVYYDMKRPSRESLMRDRTNYIRQWPSRKYWLKEKPSIKQLGNGTWEVVTRVGYEVRNSSRRLTGTAVSMMHIADTPEGLKIVSIVEN